jgi:hypothetical protein
VRQSFSCRSSASCYEHSRRAIPGPASHVTARPSAAVPLTKPTAGPPSAPDFDRKQDALVRMGDRRVPQRLRPPRATTEFSLPS